MKKPLVMVMSSGVAVGVGLALIALYSSCGSTSGGAKTGTAAFGQFISNSCSPEAGSGPFNGSTGGGDCLSLGAPSTVPADGSTISGFRAQLVDGSGNPVEGVEICFAFENPGVARIIEPTNACGLTDLNGLVSGQFQDGTQNGSFQLVATAQAGFGLQARRTISFLGGTGGLAPGARTQPCASDGNCNSALFCSFNTTCFPGPSVCTQKISDTHTPCCANEECASGTCAGGKCQASTSGSVPVGGACTTSPECQTNCCANTTGKCTAPVSCVEPACICQ
jgi:hypothetical protein